VKPDNEITHEGIVVSSGPDSVHVMISQDVSCSGCQASGICNMNERSNKIMKIYGNYKLEPGSKVLVSVSQSQGYLAVFLGYVMPLIILVASLSLTASLPAGELAAGLISVGVTAFYYMILFLFRKHISKKFSFNIKPLK